jgi:ParB-like chromosome segregation protein Spo0J
LRPASRNARTHSAAQIQQIARSIDAFGWTNPILIAPDRSIIAGHGRLEAAKLRGLANVPTITLAGLTPAQRRALVIADNQLALNAGWDEETLRLELGELGAEGFDVSLVGFSDAQLDQILADETDPTSEWQGMPEFDQPDMMAFRTLKMHFKDQAAVDAFAKLIGHPITETTRYAWFPQAETATFRDKRYEISA